MIYLTSNLMKACNLQVWPVYPDTSFPFRLCARELGATLSVGGPLQSLLIIRRITFKKLTLSPENGGQGRGSLKFKLFLFLL